MHTVDRGGRGRCQELAQVRKPLDLTSHIDGPPAVAASANVLALARDDKYVYVGHTWGVEVYDPTGEPVKRIALGEPVEALASAGGAAWAGTCGGLFRIEPGGWAVAHLALPGNVESHDRSRPEQKNNRSDRITILAADGDELWIGWIRNLQRLNTRTMTVRAFSPRELNGHHWVGAGQDFAGAGQIVPDGEYVWAADRDTLLRYESAADSWEIVQFEQRPLSFIGMIDGKLWGNSRGLDDPLGYRPAIIDRQTLKVTPLLVDIAGTNAGRLMFSFYGKRKGRLVLGGTGLYAVDEAAARIYPLSTDGGFPQVSFDLDAELPEQFARGIPRCIMPAGRTGDTLIRGGNAIVLASSEGPLVAGRHWPTGPTGDAAGRCEDRSETGLWFFNHQRQARLVSRVPQGDRIKADAIPELAVSLIADRDAKLQAEVNRDQVTIDLPDDLQAALKATNPFVRSLARRECWRRFPQIEGPSCR